jgi:hypothetical protein
MPLQNFGVVGPGIYRSAQPDAHGMRLAATDLGVTLVLKLNTREEGVTIARPSVVVWEWPLGLTAPEDDATIQQMRQLKAMVDNGQVALIHCTHGRDRTGFVAAAYHILILGVPLATALAEREAHGVDNFISRLSNHSFTEALERLAQAV